jgi:TrmH family RNA methyltransferase
MDNEKIVYKAYKKGCDYSYTLGAFPTMELIKNKPECVRCVYVHSKYDGSVDIESVCRERGIEVRFSDKAINRISTKENCMIIGIFDKFESELENKNNHVLLVNPSDMGNMGTIIRSMLGFGIKDLAIIAPCADIFNPKTVRASMGALFKMRYKIYNSYEEYSAEHGNHDMFPFMLDGDKTLDISECPKSDLYTLIYGNEATGLPSMYKEVGQSIFIPQSKDVDSLNLPISVGIGCYVFTNINRKK